MPDEKKRKIAEITAFAPSEGKASRLLINHERCSELIEWLCSEKSPDNTKQTEPEEMEEVDYFSPDLQPAKPINPQTGMPDEWNMVLAQLLRKPEEAVEQGITGRMTAEITIGGGNNHRNRRRCQQRKNKRRPPSAIGKSGVRLPLRHKVCPGKMEGKSDLLCHHSPRHF